MQKKGIPWIASALVNHVEVNYMILTNKAHVALALNQVSKYCTSLKITKDVLHTCYDKEAAKHLRPRSCKM